MNKDSNFKNGFIETKLYDESITIELTGKTCVVKLYIKYAQFIFLKDRKDRVMSFEMRFVDLLSHSDYFYRVDESLIEDYYLEIQNEFWYMEYNSFKKFSKWIENQEAMHWKKITYNNYGFSG